MKLLLFSGGIDSTALAWQHRPDVCLTIDYGQQPAKGEISASRSLAAEMGLRHEVLSIDMSTFGSGNLSGTAPSNLAIAPEWWPYRNQMLITLAAMKYVNDGLKEILIGTVASDAHGDGRAPFLRAIDRVMSVQEGSVRVSAPGRKLSSHQLLLQSGLPRELFGATFSCHVMQYACGQCRGCEKHRLIMQRWEMVSHKHRNLTSGRALDGRHQV